MKTLLEYAINQKIENVKPSLKSIISDIDDIISKLNIKIIDGIGDAQDNNPVVYKESEKATEWDGVDCSGNIVTYTLSYSWETDYNKNHGFHYREDSFKLVIKVWYDDNLDRPRYRVDDFRVLLPATNKQGYGLSSLPGYPTITSKKLTVEHYQLGVDSLKHIITTFAANTKNMQSMFDKCSDKGKKPQKSDYSKIANNMYGDILNKRM